MKKTLIGLAIIIISIASNRSLAQSASAYWALSVTTTTSVANTGNVIGFSENSSNMSVRDNTGTNGSQRAQIPGGSWPGEGQQVNSRYLQFRITPTTGNYLTVSNISLSIGGSGGSKMRANIAYSKDPSFATSTVIYSSGDLSPTALTTVSNSPSGLLLFNGDTLYLRVFPYYTAASTGKYVVLKDVLISGATNPSTATPTLSTTAVTNIAATSAKSGGNISIDGGSAIVQKGVVWGASVNPDLNNNTGFTTDGSGSAAYVSTLSSLIPNTVYHVRAYATNSTGTGYGNDIQFATSLQTTSYYNKPKTDVTNRLNWGTNADGSGTPPPGFSSAGQVFNIVNDSAYMSSTWVVLGTDSKVILGNGIQPLAFTIPSAYNYDGIIDVQASAVLIIKNSIALSFGSISNSATINFDGTNVIPVSYPNLGLLNGANFPSTGTIGINGNFNPGNVITATAGSTVSFNGTGAQILPSTFTFDSLVVNNPLTTLSGNLSINRGLLVNQNFSIDSAKTLTLFGSATLTVTITKTLTVYGTIDNQSNGAVMLAGNNMTVKGGGAYKVNGSGITSSYFIPPAVYEQGSDLLILKGSGKMPVDVGGNVTYNSTSNTSLFTFASNIGGNFNVLNGTINNGSGRTLTIGGDLNVNGGFYNIGPPVGAGNGQTTTVNGNVNILSGSINITALDASATYLSSLNVKGNLVHTGGSLGFNVNNPLGRVNFTGTNQTFSTIGITNPGTIYIGNESASPTVTLKNNLLILSGSLLKIIDGSMIIPSNTTLTVAGIGDFSNKSVVFKSDSTGTASLGKVTGTIIGGGNVTVERYISSLNNPAYRLLAPSLNTTGTIKDNWQTGGAGAGTQITGSTSGANGFDPSPSGQSSVSTYNVDITPTTDIVPAWIPLPNTNVKKLEADTGYMVYIRGDRTINLYAADTTTSTNTTLKATGTLVTGTRIFNNLRATVYNLITNPYPSAINWRSVRNSNPDLLDRYIYLDPNIGTRGGYVVVNGDSSTSPVLSNVNSPLDIQSGMAFFVRPLNTTTVLINETHKSSVNNLDVFRTNNGSTERLTSSLYFKLPNGSRRLADGVTSLYSNNYSAGYGFEDALQLANFDEDVAIMSNSRMLALEGRPLIDSNETLQLNVANLREIQYEWQFSTANFNTSILSAVLKDNFLNTTTPINLNGTTNISFNVTSAPASSAADRFQVVFSPAISIGDTIQASTCSGGNITINSEVSGTQYQWQVYNGSGFVNITNSQTYQGTNTSALQISSIPASSYGSKFRCMVTTNNGVVNSKIYSVIFKNYWTGSVSNNWEDVSNWSCGKVPDGNTDVVLSSGTVMVNSNALCRSLQLYTGANVIVTTGHNLSVTH